MKTQRSIWITVLMLALVALATHVSLSPPPARAAGPWYVGPGGSDGNNCLTPATRCATINGALGKASSGDTIRVQVGTYTGSGNEVVLLNKSATLSGGWNSTFTTQNGMSTIDGQGTRRGVTVNSGVTATIEWFVMQNGYDSFALRSGGIVNNGTLTLNNGTVSNNTGYLHAGGIDNNNGSTLTLNNSIVSSNTPQAGGVGGGIYNDAAGIVTLNNSTVSNNRGNGGSGIRNNGGTVTLNNSIVTGNKGSGDGGGITNISGGTLTLNNSAVIHNAAGSGGGIANEFSATMILNNSTVSRNTSDSNGGGILNGSNSTATLNSSTVSGNISTFTSGGGVYNDLYSNNSNVSLLNSIITGNNSNSDGTDCRGNIGSSGYNVIGNTVGCTFTPTTGDLTNINPKLGSLQGSPAYHPLLSGSPAINAGNPSGCMGTVGLLTTDQRGMPRVGRCDIGAYEFGLSASKAASGSYTAGQTLTYIVTLRNDANSNITGIAITDTVPTSLTYVPGSFSASTGAGGENGGVITWNGTVPANSTVSVSFQAAIDNSAACSFITNKALIGSSAGSGGFEVQTSGITDCACNLTKAPGNPVLSVGSSGAWDDNDVWRPMVLKEGSSYKMWYVADDGSNPSRIGLATSSDGLAWNKSGSNPVLSPGGGWEAGGLSGGSVITDTGQYKMWYTAFDGSGVGRIGYATSANGISWAKHGSNPVLDVGFSNSWEDADVMFPSVVKQGGVYHMWYEGSDGSGQSTHRIGHATSTDGINWTKDSANPVLDVGPGGAWDWLDTYGPNVIQYNNTFIMWYSGHTLPEAWQTGYAISTNGSNWTRQELLIPEGPAGAFDNASADYASVIPDGSDFKVWYSGYNGSNYAIGYATAEVCNEAGGAPSGGPIYLPIVLKGGSGGTPSCPAYYTDNFSNSDSGWPISDTSARQFAYTGGEYRIWVKNPNSGWWVTPGAKATDFTAAVSARRASGTTGGYGIVFGINENGNQWYEFIIGANSYSIWKFDNGYGPPLRNWTFSPAIATGTSWNRLKVIRQGSSISVYINNQFLTTVSDSSFTGFKRIGLTAGSGSSSGIDARFDNFSLYPASCGVSAAEVGFEMGKPEIRQRPALPELDEGQ